MIHYSFQAGKSSSSHRLSNQGSFFQSDDEADRNSKITYCRICMNTNICVCFRVWGWRRRSIWRWWQNFCRYLRLNRKSLQKLIKTFSPWYPLKKGTPLWALYDGNSIVRWYISRTAGSKFNLYSNPSEIWYWKTFYSVSKGEVTKAFNWKFFPK